MSHKIIIDTDPGVDDAMAILYAFLDPQIELIGLTSIFGNVTTDIATRNALRLVELAGKSVPVAAGAQKPLAVPRREPAWEVHGREGFGTIPAETPALEPVHETAAEFICEMAHKYAGELVLCPDRSANQHRACPAARPHHSREGQIGHGNGGKP